MDAPHAGIVAEGRAMNQAKSRAEAMKQAGRASSFPPEFPQLSIRGARKPGDFPSNLPLISAWTSLIGTQQSEGAKGMKKTPHL
jgi:hypothetical protein